jgi:predicted ATPase/class 3 adenylate cyclase/Tfp pilus assembly protein PilF
MSGQAPTGNVSLVFTDVQGSTALWERAPEGMRAALKIHDQVLRAAIAANHGYEVKTEGDAFMVAFASPFDAAKFCLDTQLGLLAADWPEEILAQEIAGVAPQRKGLRVRMGIHTGEPESRPDPTTGRMDYFGPVVNRAARISAAGHGGQVLLSEDVWKEIQPRLASLGDPVGVSLGEHRLRDLESASRLYQILPAALAERNFPPLKTLDAHKTNLQANPTAFIGREHDLAALRDLFQKGERLVTLMGPGGTGKTRLSMRFAAVHLAEFTRDGGGGAWFCDLTEARSLDGVCASVGAALNVPLTSGKTSADMVIQLGHAIAGRGRILLVMDNFEQVIAHAPETLGAWHKTAPLACFLVSSQERLRLPGEVPYEVKPLALPVDAVAARASEAVQLFVARAQAVRPGWTLSDAELEAVAGIVRELDGIPLAIELAAARIGVLSPAKILERLPRRFDLLGGARRDASSRQATLRGAIDWSWNLLKPHEQDALAQCSVFHGGFTVEAAEEVLDLSAHPGAPWPLDVVESLRDKSLLAAGEPPDFPGELRLAMYSNIRQFAQEKLDADVARAEAAKVRHGVYYLRVGGEWAEGVDGAGGLEKLRRLALERENLSTVFFRAKATVPPTADSATRAFQALLALDPVLSTRGPFGVHLAWLDDAVAHAASVEVEAGLKARVMEARGRARRIRGRMVEASADFEAAMTLAAKDPSLESRILAQVGLLDLQGGNITDAEARLQRGLALAAVAKDKAAAAKLLGFLGGVYGDLGRIQQARENFSQSLAIFRELGDLRSEGLTLTNMGIVLLGAGELKEARVSLERALTIHRETGDRRFEGNALGCLASVELDESRFAEAHDRFSRAIAIHREVGNRRSEATFRGNFGIAEQLAGRAEVAAGMYLEAVEIFREAGERRAEGLYLGYLAAARAELGELDRATELFAVATARLEEMKASGFLEAVNVLHASLDFARASAADISGHPETAAEFRSSATQRIAAGREDAGSVEDIRRATRLVERMAAENRSSR